MKVKSGERFSVSAIITGTDQSFYILTLFDLFCMHEQQQYLYITHTHGKGVCYEPFLQYMYACTAPVPTAAESAVNQF